MMAKNKCDDTFVSPQPPAKAEKPEPRPRRQVMEI